jgi:hypothetical protein
MNRSYAIQVWEEDRSYAIQVSRGEIELQKIHVPGVQELQYAPYIKRLLCKSNVNGSTF